MRTLMRSLALPAAAVALAFVGRYAVPWPVPRAVLTVPALLWVPGLGVLSALDLRRAAGKWSVPLAMLLSIIVLIAASLISYAGFGYVPLSALPLWVSLGALPLCALHPAPAQTGRELLRKAGRVATFGVGAAAIAGLVAGLVHVLPQQKQPGYLAFSFSGDYATVPGVVQARAGATLDVPVAVTGAGEDLRGLTVSVARDGAPIANTAAVPVAIDASGQGYARIQLPIANGCISRYSFTLRRDAASLRLLDLYVTTDHLATCHGG
jgi:hypothetical protein